GSTGTHGPPLASDRCGGTRGIHPPRPGECGDQPVAAPAFPRGPAARRRHLDSRRPRRRRRRGAVATRRADPRLPTLFTPAARGHLLRYLDDLPETEVAAAPGCFGHSVKSHASRGLARLRESTHLSLPPATARRARWPTPVAAARHPAGPPPLPRLRRRRPRRSPDGREQEHPVTTNPTS